MISKLPRWAAFGGAVLAFIAGIINAVGFLGVHQQGLTHLTGSTTLLGIAVATHDLSGVVHLAAIIAAFLVGAVASGFIIQDSTLSLGRRYGVALVIESALLFLAVPLLRGGSLAGDYLASCACGLQNAMASTYSGAVLRTTHVSGAFTDIGILVGQWLRRLPVDVRRLRLSVALILAFGAGGSVGTLAFKRLSYDTLFIPATLTGLGGLIYGAYRHRQIQLQGRDKSISD